MNLRWIDVVSVKFGTKSGGIDFFVDLIISAFVLLPVNL